MTGEAKEGGGVALSTAQKRGDFQREKGIVPVTNSKEYDEGKGRAFEKSLSPRGRLQGRRRRKKKDGSDMGRSFTCETTRWREVSTSLSRKPRSGLWKGEKKRGKRQREKSAFENGKSGVKMGSFEAAKPETE